MKCIDKELLESNWKEQMRFNDKYNDYNHEFFDLLSDLKHMWDGYRGLINIVKHLIELRRRLDIDIKHHTMSKLEIASLNMP